MGVLVRSNRVVLEVYGSLPKAGRLDPRVFDARFRSVARAS
jgi:hypothetical protein